MNSGHGGITGSDESPDALAALDLNLLTALRALLRERSVTQAAARLSLGQSGASAALRRLRAHFGDPLLVRNGTAYELSPLAAGLRPAVEEALAAVESVLLASTFHPSTSRRVFTVMAADEAMVLLGERLLPRLGHTPGLGLELVALTDAALHDVDATLRAVDVLLMPRGQLAGHPAVDLWEDEIVLVAGNDTFLSSEDATPQRLGEMHWISSFHAPSVIASLEARGIQPRVRVVLPSYAVVPMLLAGSAQHVALIPRRIAERLGALGGARVLTPWGGPMNTRMAMWWHASRERDAGHAWFRAQVLEVTAELRRSGAAAVAEDLASG
ncbi:LysR family transcriptional regulator [Kineosporia rhizophila]|uniref:LysR family transcriptional regulator n=1 Tax=Kineosporia TaxID=49184 RepID=UPI000B1B3165|nr:MULTISPECIES: LysR family transcriptional regulator [Kineosporia]MCE0536467.1 LysR family transcriptional regulator [Kineosporia rhizophila]GLY15439.1 LysR family transcriptional regulator [Kineosporia sp. NBRC 101677]